MTGSRAEAKTRTRQALIEAAGAVFAERGYEAASVDELAREAGYTIGALYAHFPRKEALFLAMIEERVKDEARRLRHILTSADDVEGRIAALGAAFEADTAEQRRTTLLLMEFWLYCARHGARRPDIAAGFLAWQAGFRKAVAGYLAPAEDGGAPDSEALAALLLALCEGLARQRVLAPGLARRGVLETGLRVLLGHPARP